MESCNGTLIPSKETGAAATVTSTTVSTSTSTTPTITSARNGEAHGEEDEDSNFDRLTQMLPECFVSVKLENNEETCVTESSTSKVSIEQKSSSQTTQVVNEQVLCQPPTKSLLLDMQNTQQASMNTRVPPSAHCFHHRATTACAVMTELPPWLQHCYTTGQMATSETIQQGPQHFHQSTAYLAHDGSIVQGERSLKSGTGVTRLDTNIATGIGGLSNGDICDSNTFLNYVLNQQRNSGIFLFDPIRSLHPNEHNTETATTTTTQENNVAADVSHQQNVSSKNTNDVSIKYNTSPSSIPPVDGNPSRRDAATNTISKYSQVLPVLPLNSDAKSNTGDYSDDSDNPITPVHSKTFHLHHCTKCAVTKITNMCHEERLMQDNNSTNQNVATDYTLGGMCHKINSTRNCPTDNCTNIQNTKVENGKLHTNFIVVSAGSSSNTQQEEQHTHNTCNCTVDNTLIIKAEGQTNNAFSGSESNGKFGNLQLSRTATNCKCMNDCGNMCIKDNRRIHYVDIDRPFTCEICFKNYPTSTALMNHMRYHRGQRPYQCEVCNKAFATNSHLVTHRRVHTGERPFQCRLCRRSFADRSAYVKHERTHGPNGTIIKRYKCEECGNAFVDSCGLKKHVRIHTGERPYCCSVCQKTFSTSSTFVAHKRIHSGERPYKCENCDKMFITKSHLLTHRRTHTGEKPFSCQVCNRAFADGSSFRRHERLHTGENRHTCDICGKGFPFDTSLAKHKQSHIPGTPTYVYMV